MKHCPSPAKIPYRNEADAIAQLKHFKANSRENKKTLNKVHVYRCPSGEHWHLGHDKRRHVPLASSASILPVANRIIAPKS